MAIKRFAAIDVGSFALEMGIYEIGPRAGIRQVNYVRHVIALGKDTYNTGKVSYELVEEMLTVLEDFTDIMKEYKVDAYSAYATSAMREAGNSQIILDQIKVRTGIEVKIISNSEQRFISYKAIAAKDDQFDKIIKGGTAIVDVSFGSMQITLYDKGNIISTQNLSLGVLRIRETIAKISTAREERTAILGELVDNELETYSKLYLKDREVKCMVGIGETILLLFKRLSAISGADSKREFITREDFMRAYDYVLSKTEDELGEALGVDAEFAGVFGPCVLIFSRVFELLGAESIWLPGTLLVDGIAAEYAEDNGLIRLKHNFQEDILEAARNIAKRYRGTNQHMINVEQNAMAIFDATQKFHGLDKRDRLLLRISAIMHNCGKFVSMRAPAACTYDIISASEIIGLSHEERITVARIVRNLEEFSYDEMSMQVAKLTAMLQLANSLDRSHKQKVRDYKFKMNDENELMIITGYPGDMTLEYISFEQHRKFFEEIFGIRPLLIQKKGI